MKKILLLLTAALFSAHVFPQAQLHVFEDWSTNQGSQDFLFKNATVTDASSNVYIAGGTMTSTGTYDILVAKYNSNGVQQWIQQYNGSDDFHDMATALYVDGSGNVYITGVVVNDTTTHLGDVITIKYNSSGTQQWASTYNGTGSLHDAGSDIFVDGGGSVYVAGASYNATPNTDMIAIKYNSSGTQQWVGRYNHSSNMDDVATRIGINLSLQVVITGAVQTGLTNYQCANIKYNISTGAQISATITTGGSSGITQVNDVTEDALGNIYVLSELPVTSQGLNYSLMKFNAAMVLSWHATYNGSDSLDDVAKGVAVDASGNVYVTGYVSTSAQGRDMTTIKYNSSGTQQWVASYNDTLDLNDEGYGVALDASGNPYVTGYHSTSLAGKNYYTIKYNSSGTQQWAVSADGINHLNDVATNIVIDNSGGIVITGQSETASLVYEYVTKKYIEKNLFLPYDTIEDIQDPILIYYSNKGQLKDYSDVAVSDIIFYTNYSGPQLFIKPSRLSIVYKEIDADSTTLDTIQRIDMTLQNASSASKIYKTDEAKTTLNYFKNGEEYTDVKGGHRLVASDIYQNIDLYYDSNLKGFKFYFVVKANGNPGLIKMNFEGASVDSVYGTDSIVIYSLMDTIGLKCHAYQSGYSLSPVLTKDTADIYSISNLSYNTSQPLTIKFDQGYKGPGERHLGAPDWATPFGGTGEDVSMDVKHDDDGNSYWVGYTNSDPTSFPTNDGFTFTHTGGYDAFICKFGSPREPIFTGGFVDDGDALLWVTYWGGSNEDKGLSLDVTGNTSSGHVYVTGYTASTDFHIESVSPFYNDGYSGAKDAFLIDIASIEAGVSLSGSSSTFIGGLGDDIANDIKYKSNVLAIGGITYSDPSVNTCVIPNGTGDTGFPLCSATFHSVNSGNGDGFLLKVNNSGAVLKSEFIGGSAYDCINELVFNNSSDLYFTGTTESGALSFDPIALSGAYNQATSGGLKDALIGKQATTAWLSYYGGDENDYGNAISLKASDQSVLMAGTTESLTPACTTCFCGVPSTSGEFPICPKTGAYFQGNPVTGAAFGGGSSDGFICEFDNAGVFTWGTYRGGANTDVINGITVGGVDVASTSVAKENVFIAGETYSTNTAVMQYYNSSLPGYFVVSTSPPPFTGSSDGYFCFFDEDYQKMMFEYMLGEYSGSSPILDAGNLHTSINAVSTWSYHVFMAGYTTNPNARCKVSSGMDFDGNYGAYLDAQLWPFNSAVPIMIGSVESDAYFIRLSQEDMPMVGINELEPVLTPSFLIFPNPSTGLFRFKTDDLSLTGVTLRVYDILGKEVYRKEKFPMTPGHMETLDLSDQCAGIYSVIISNADFIKGLKVIKQ